MAKYLITGFSGFVSYYFLNLLNRVAENGEKTEILGVDLALPPDYDTDYKFENLNIRFLSMNLLDVNSLEIAIHSFYPDYIVHFASFSSVGASWKDPIGCFMNNTNIFLNMVEAVRKIGIKCRILSIGSSEEYGNVTRDQIPLTEEKKLQPVSPYAIARVSQEMLSKCYVDSFGLDIVLTRSFNHIGPRQRDCFVVPSFIKQILEQKKQGVENISISTGDLSIIRDFLDVRDVVKAYYLLLQKGKKGELYNVCKGEGRSLKEIVDLIAEIAGVKVTAVTDPEKIRPNDNMVIVGSNRKIIEDTGWQTEYSLEETLKEMIEKMEQKK